MKLRSKIVEIEATDNPWRGYNVGEMQELAQEENITLYLDAKTGDVVKLTVWNESERQWITVPIGCYILRGLDNELYPCESTVMFKKYDIVDSNE